MFVINPENKGSLPKIGKANFSIIALLAWITWTTVLSFLSKSVKSPWGSDGITFN